MHLNKKQQGLIIVVAIVIIAVLSYMEVSTDVLVGVTNNCQKCNIAIIKPVFTHTAYYNDAFYDFYNKHINDTITYDVSKLTTQIISGWENSSSYGSYQFFRPFIANNTMNVITDVDVHLNRIKQYDILILLHSEYVTQQYYDNLRKWVANGGTLLVIDANSLYTEIIYYNSTNTIRHKLGHSWSFNGTVAVRSISERWLEDNKQFIGSNYAGPGNYGEENVITNSKAVCLYEWERLPAGIVCTYVYGYGHGIVYHTGITASWKIQKLPSLQSLILTVIGQHHKTSTAYAK